MLEFADTYEQAGEPDWLLEAFGSVWVLADDGHVLGLDPATGEVQTDPRHRLPQRAGVQGLGHDETALWICAGTEPWHASTRSAGTVTRVPVAKRSDEGRLAFSGGLLWYLETGSNDLVGLDDTTAEATRVPLGEVCTDLAFDAEVVFALCPSTHDVLRVDAASGTVSGSMDVGNPRAGAVGEDLFVGDGGGMLQVDTETLEVLHTYEGVGPALGLHRRDRGRGLGPTARVLPDRDRPGHATRWWGPWKRRSTPAAATC